MALEDREVAEVVLSALEAVVTGGPLVPLLRAAVTKAPYVSKSQRIHLNHMLQHAAEREFIEASAPLYPGLEGAFGEVAVLKALITAERMRTDNPNKKVKFETGVVRALGLDTEFENLV